MIRNLSNSTQPYWSDDFDKKLLPLEITSRILSFVKDKDLSATTSVSYRWKEATIDFTKRKKFSPFYALHCPCCIS